RAKKGAVSTYDNIAMVEVANTFVDSYSEEQLDYFLDIIKPRATNSDAKLIESLTPRVDPEMKKKFLYNFWLKRNQLDPYGEWLKYLELVTAVNREFGTPSRPGYRTDRGRVYLQYGPPSDRLQAPNEPNAYPYEIWFYDTLPDKQTKIGFAFYSTAIATNDYRLLHSNARGEVTDNRWKVTLYENVASPQELFDLDNTEVMDKLGAVRPVDVYNF
ncbi:MAG: GWxTD domain-containing protein, partial [Chitinophagales bacterium]